MKNHHSAVESIAVVGIGCRLPGGVRGPKSLVEFLEANGDGIVPVPPERWDTGRFAATDKNVPGRSYTFFGGFLRESVFDFDPNPFGISPREAEFLDPQQRLLLESTLDALEDAGIQPQALRGSNTGAYVGAFNVDMRDIVSHPGNSRAMGPHTATGTSHTVISNRLSYTFDWHGPSFTVDTACSSSLVTIHYACRDLLAGIVDLAVAGGVNVMLSPLSTAIMCKGQFLAADGRSKAFDAAADGYGRGEGVGLVVLKRLSDAERDGDRIYALIRGSGVNQDGKTDGLPMPNGRAQADLCRRVTAEAGIDPTRVGFVEAHGTGTRAGDPIEANALAEVYCAEGRTVPLGIGSIKANIGHLEAAAGVTGLIKVALSLYHDRLFPLRALGTPNPDIAFDALLLRVVTRTEPWPENLDRTAAVNSFGYGGTNAHAVLQAHAPHSTRESTQPADNPVDDCHCTVISGYDATAVSSQALQLLHSAEPLALRSYFAHGRQLASSRALLWGDSSQDWHEALEALVNGTPHPRVISGTAPSGRPKVLWVFTGMGPQWWAMGRRLLLDNQVFREAAQEVDAHFQGHSGWSIVTELLRDEQDTRMGRNYVAQPANFLLQVALAKLLAHWGVPADGYLGHSVGELAAAWASGALDLATACKLAYVRSDIQQLAAGRGTMAALAVSVEEAERYCKESDDLSVAAINGADSVALAGGPDALARVVEAVSASGRFAKMMQVEVAYHSHHMDCLESAFRERLADLPAKAPTVPLYSTARGVAITHAAHDAQYWWENARNPVLLRQAVGRALADGYQIAIEVGPHPVLAQSIQAAASELETPLTLCHTQRRGVDARDAMLRCAGQLLAANCPVRLDALVPECARTFADDVGSLYPFSRKRYWFETPEQEASRIGRAGAHPLLAEKCVTPGPTFETVLGGQRFSWLVDHEVEGTTIFPGAGYIEAALALVDELADHQGELVVEALTIESPLVIDQSDPPRLRVELKGYELAIASYSGEAWTVHASAHVSRRARFTEARGLERPAAGLMPVDLGGLYASLERRGLHYGPSFRCISELERSEDTVCAELRVPQVAQGYVLFPGVLDSAFQALLSLLPPEVEGAVVPVSIGTIRMLGRILPGDSLTLIARAGMSGSELVAELAFYGRDGELVCSLDDLVCRPVKRRGEAEVPIEWLHERVFVPIDAVSVGAARPTFVVVAIDEKEGHAVRMSLQRQGCQACTDLSTALADNALRLVYILSEPEEPSAEEELTALMLLGQELPQYAGASFTLITRGAYQVLPGDVVRPCHTAAVGFARVLMTEHPELDIRVLDAGSGTLDVKKLTRFLLSDVEEEEVGLREGRLWALRVQRTGGDRAFYERARAPLAGEAFELFSERPGRLESLCYRPRYFADCLGHDEVEVEIEAASLNFKDVMKALGLLDSVALENTYLGNQLGLDCAGRVTRLGAGVCGLSLGDLVFAFAPGSLGSRVRVNQRYVVRAARGHTATEACSYCVYQTVWLGLKMRADLSEGERILIHSAAGGVGVAAIQLARHLGAEIYATAGTEEKRSFLRELGISHVYDSRSLDYSREILRDTEGRGVDVVLNSLAGDALRHNLKILAAGGRHVELGKQDMARNTQLSMRPFNRALSLIAIDMDRMALEKPAYYQPVAKAVVRAFEAGIFQPMPTEVFPADESSAAFSRLSSGKQIGKVVLDFSGGVKEVRPGLSRPPLFRKDRCYLVTGGLGGFGLQTALWMMRLGAGELVLASRRGKLAPSDEAALAHAVETTGAHVRCVALDVTVEGSVHSLVAELATGERPLAGVVHSAMVLHDMPISALTYQDLCQVTRPKALGAWHLHEATKELALDHFVMYSSVSAVAGNPGQAAYAAANAYLDGLARLRRSLGLPGTTIQWGALADVGVVAESDQVAGHLKSVGILPIPAARALGGLRAALAEGAVERGIIDIDWDRWVRTTPETRWNRLVDVLGQRDSEASTKDRFAEELSALAGKDRDDYVVRALQAAIAPIFKMPSEQVGADKPLKDFGLDSLMALEVQVAIEERTGVEISTMELLAGRSVNTIAITVLKRLPSDSPNARAPKSAEPTPSESAQSGPTQSEPRDLTEYFLERICVQRPYFALENVRRDGEWLEAIARPTAPGEREDGPISVAEAARHATILASCAARVHSKAGGRIYFPVKSADLTDCDGSEVLPLVEVELRARCLSFDAKGSLAKCRAEVWSGSGQLLFGFDVELHVIAEDEFRALFHHAQMPTFEASGEDPYRKWQPLPAVHHISQGARVQLGAVLPSQCLGHFVEYPAYPVSMMVRDALSLVAELIQNAQSAGAYARDDLRVRVVGGRAQTFCFAFVGQELEMSAERKTSELEGERYIVSLLADGELCATFDMDVALHVASSNTRSLVVGPPDDLDLLG